VAVRPARGGPPSSVAPSSGALVLCGEPVDGREAVPDHRVSSLLSAGPSAARSGDAACRRGGGRAGGARAARSTTPG